MVRSWLSRLVWGGGGKSNMCEQLLGFNVLENSNILVG